MLVLPFFYLQEGDDLTDGLCYTTKEITGQYLYGVQNTADSFTSGTEGKTPGTQAPFC